MAPHITFFSLGGASRCEVVCWDSFYRERLIYICDAMMSRGRNEDQNVHQMHRDIITDLPEGVEDLGSSARCRWQGMYLANRLITVQGHPEFNEEIVRDILETRHQQGVFDHDLFEDAMKRVDRPHDGVIVAQAFLKFCLEGLE